MTTPINDPDDEKPLDPVLEKVRTKMIRLLVVSIGIMFAGLMAVLIAIVYKSQQPSGAPATAESGWTVPSDAPIRAEIDLPAGFKVASTSLSGDKILFFGEGTDGVSKVYIYDIAAKSLIADLTVGAK